MTVDRTQRSSFPLRSRSIGVPRSPSSDASDATLGTDRAARPLLPPARSASSSGTVAPRVADVPVAPGFPVGRTGDGHGPIKLLPGIGPW